MHQAYKLAGVLFCLSLFGCAQKTTNVVGDWVGNIQLSEHDQKVKALVDNAKKMGSSMISLRDDHTFKLSTIEGTWSLADSTITLHPTKFNDKPIADLKAKLKAIHGTEKLIKQLEQPMLMTVDPGGKTLTMASPSPNSTSKIVYAKHNR